MAHQQSSALSVPGRSLFVDAWFRRPAPAVALIVLVTCLAYLPALRGDFILDDDLLLQNQLVKDPGGLGRIWFTTDPIDYWPVTNSVFWIEWRLWGTNPLGYHLINLALHITAALLVWAVLRQLAIPGAYLAAFLFAVHPVNVETVAWISQLKTVLAGVFFLLSILCYLKADPLSSRDRSDWGAWYWLSVAAFVLGMLSKASVATLPLVLLLMVWWNRGQIASRDLLRTAPYFLFAAPLVLVNMWFQNRYSHEIIRSFAERLVGAGAIPWFYLSKALWPVNLVFIYPQWDIQPGNPLWWLPLLASVAVTGVLWWQRSTRFGRPLLFAWAFYWLALAPVLGFTDVSYMKWSLVADHYQYLAITSIVALVAAGITWAVAQLSADVPWAGAVPSAVMVALLTFLTWQQSTIYRDPITVYRATIDKNPECYIAYNNLAGLLLETDRPQAIGLCERALQINPDYAEAHNNLGALLVHSGRESEAAEHYRRALQLKPNFADVYDNLGVLLLNTGRSQEAIAQFEKALELRPYLANAHNNWGKALLATGQLQGAIEHFEKAVQISPGLVDAQHNLGAIYSSQNRLPEAVDHYQRALQADPGSATLHNDLGAMLFRLGRGAAALQHFQEAQKLSPTDPDINFNLGKALFHAGRPQAASELLRQALQLQPNFPDADHILGMALISLGHAQEGLDHLERAAQLTTDDLDLHSDLATALVYANQAAKAIEHFEVVARGRPDQPGAYNNLGAALLLAERPKDAVEQFERAVQLQPDYAEAWTSLAAAYAKIDRSADAIAAAQKASDLARSQGKTALTAQVEAWLKDYQSGAAKPTGVPAVAPPASPALPPP